jgi:tRNA-splicing ligase RtcB
MQKKFNYPQKNVHDIYVNESFVRLWHHGGGFDEKCILETFQPLLKSSFVYPYAALMPDFHQSGKNMVGSVIPTRQVIFPSVIGNDIGCGMLGIKLLIPIHNKSNLQDLLSDFKKVIPVGRDQNRTIAPRVKDNPLWYELDKVVSINKRDQGHLVRQFGSLGGGNHFLEILEDENGDNWILIHTGYRNTGALINEYFIKVGAQHPGVDRNMYRKIPYINTDSHLARQYLSDF